MRLLQAFKEWSHKRRWPMSEQVAVLRNILENDARWMAHDQKVVALTSRYAAVLADDWMKCVHISSDSFRKLLGAEPNYAKPTIGRVRFFPVFKNLNIGPPHQTFFAASQGPNITAILRVEIDMNTLLVISAVTLDKSNAHELEAPDS